MAQGSEHLDEATAGLVACFASVSATHPELLSGPVALARTRTLLALGEQLTAVIAQALRDVDERELFVLDEAGSTRSWLRTQPCGEAQHATRARQLGRHPVVDAALRDGVLSAATASVVCAQLQRVPDEVPDSQLYGLLVHGVPDLLQTWTGGLVADDLVTDELIARREEAAAVLRACAEDTLSSPAQRLEPVFVLLARTVTPAHLLSSLQALVDALLPEQLAEQEQDSYDDTYLRIRKVITGGWDLIVHLDDVAGQSLVDQLEAKVRALLQGLAPARDAGPAVPTAVQDELPVDDETGTDVTGTDEASDVRGALHAVPDDEVAHDVDAAEATSHDQVSHDQASRDHASHDDVEAGSAPRCGKRSLYDAFVALLLDAAASVGLGQPRPAHLTIVTTLAEVEGRPGANPGTLTTAGGAVPLPRETVRRIGCDSVLSAVLLDARGNPVGASGSHRHANERERRALRAQWGPTCAVLGCASTLVVPHHVEPWWLTRRTRLRHLIPVCQHHHRDVHEGGRTLRIRDGRLITPTGWGAPAAAAA